MDTYQSHWKLEPWQAQLSDQGLSVNNAVKGLRWGELIALWRLRIRTRAQLLTLSDEALCDVGLSRAEALAEAAKPFWQG